MRTRQSYRNQDRLYFAIGRELHQKTQPSSINAELMEACKLAFAQLRDIHTIVYPSCDGDSCLTYSIIVKLQSAIKRAGGTV